MQSGKRNAGTWMVSASGSGACPGTGSSAHKALAGRVGEDAPQLPRREGQEAVQGKHSEEGTVTIIY